MTCPCNIESCSSKVHVLDYGKVCVCSTLGKSYVKLEGEEWKVWDFDNTPLCFCTSPGCIAEDCGSGLIRCPTSTMVIDDVGPQYWGPRLKAYKALTDAAKLVWGDRTVQSDNPSLDAINVRRMALEVEKQLQEACGSFIGQQNTQETREAMAQAMLKSMEPLAASLTEKPDVNVRSEKWTSMQGCGWFKGIRNRILNKLFGSSIRQKNIAWYHLALGYELKPTSFISVEPYLVQNPNSDEETFLYQIEDGMWNDNAHHNASVSAVIQTPQTVADIKFTPVRPVESIKMDFTIKGD